MGWLQQMKWKKKNRRDGSLGLILDSRHLHLFHFLLLLHLGQVPPLPGRCLQKMRRMRADEEMYLYEVCGTMKMQQGAFHRWEKMEHVGMKVYQRRE